MQIFGKTITKSDVAFFCLLLFLLLPNLLALFVATDFPIFGAQLIYFLGTLTFYFFGLCVLKMRTFFYVYSIFLFAHGVELVHLIINQSTTSYLFFFTVIKSEKGEFLELLSHYWFVLVIFLAIWSVYFVVNKRYVSDEFLFSSKLTRKIGASVSVFYWLVCGVGLFFAPKYPQILSRRAENFQTSAWVGIKKVCPVNFAYHSVTASRDALQMKIYQQQVQNFTFDLTASEQAEKQLVVLFIGETSRYDHWTINGYERNTSPNMMRRKDQIVSFDSCYTIGNLTAICVPYLLSPAAPTNKKDYYLTKTLPEAFQEVGYKTAWIANQSYNNTYLLRIAGTTDFMRYVGQDEKIIDEALLPYLQEFIHDTACCEENQFAVVHSLGCHFDYSTRYTDSFQVFCPDMKGSFKKEIIESIFSIDTLRTRQNRVLINNLRPLFINSYDNALCYTDYILEQVIQMLEESGKSAVLVYISDHGENLFDDKRNMFFHGTFNGSVYEYHVPLFVWTSEKFRTLYPEKMATLQHNKHKKISSMNIFHSLLDMQNIEGQIVRKEKSIFSPQLVSDSIIYGLDANLNTIKLPIQ